MPQVRGIHARGLQLRRDPDTDRQIEWQTHTCRHCNRVVDVIETLPPEIIAAFGLRNGIGGFCEFCQSAVCEQCAKAATEVDPRTGTVPKNARAACSVFAERIERALFNQARRQAMGL